MSIDTQLMSMFGKDWYEELTEFLHTKTFLDIAKYVREKRKITTVYPETELVFKAFRETGYLHTKVVLFDKSPYHDGSADGLAFSCSKNSTSCSPSLQIMLQEIENSYPENKNSIEEGKLDPWDLTRWARQGVLLLNTALTVEEGTPKSHLFMWSSFLKAVIQALNKRTDIVYLLLGQDIQKLTPILNPKNKIISVPHPGLEVFKPGVGFLGSNVFRQVNEHLNAINKQEIIW